LGISFTWRQAGLRRGENWNERYGVATARGPKAVCATNRSPPLLRQRVDLEDLDFALDLGHAAGVARPQPNGPGGARFLPVGLSVGVATSTASPS
jgi:hypothetical protein